MTLALSPPKSCNINFSWTEIYSTSRNRQTMPYFNFALYTQPAALNLSYTNQSWEKIFARVDQYVHWGISSHYLWLTALGDTELVQLNIMFT